MRYVNILYGLIALVILIGILEMGEIENTQDIRVIKVHRLQKVTMVMPAPGNRYYIYTDMGKTKYKTTHSVYHSLKNGDIVEVLIHNGYYITKAIK